MATRTARERLYQTIGYEVGGFLVATPVCAMLVGEGPGAASALVAVLSLATLFWAPLFNIVFDRIEWSLFRQPASARRGVARLAHAALLETSDSLMTLPILVFGAGLPLHEALIADIGLTLIWTCYTYAFHLCFDRARPVRA